MTKQKKKRNKPYIPKSKHNPAVQSFKIDELGGKLEELQHAINSISISHDRHIDMLTNFVRHDIKNGLQTLDGILYNANDMLEETKDRLKAATETMKQSIENFADIVPVSSNEPFLVSQLFKATDMLTKPIASKHGVNIRFEKPTEDILINQSLQSFIQILHNFIINAIKAVEANQNSKLIEVVFCKHENAGVIKVSDNGISIESVDKVWRYKYSTTGGTGIGLHHVKYLLDAMKGACHCENTASDLYTKFFSVTFPLNFSHE